MKKEYRITGTISKLEAFFEPYLNGFDVRTGENIFWMVLAILVLGSVQSIRFLYRHFLAWNRKRVLNCCYRVLNEARWPENPQFWETTARKLLRLIPLELRQLPVFLLVDDTLIPKFGKHFDHVKVLFDHAAHDGIPHKNGHCFVTLMMVIPIGLAEDGKVEWLAVPLLHKMWVSGAASKLQIAREKVEAMRPVLSDVGHVVLQFDAWYAKKELLSLSDDWQALDIVRAARVDTVMYDPPPPPTGKRGRPRKRGDRVRPADFEPGDIGLENYIGGMRTVLTKIFGAQLVTALVTAAAGGGGSRRLYLSTIAPEKLTGMFDGVCIPQMNILQYVYKLRWHIETYYLQAKMYWNLCDYKVRSREGIERLLNIEAIAYAAMQMLPHCWEELADLRDDSPQVVRLEVGRAVQEDLIYDKLRSLVALSKHLNVRPAFHLRAHCRNSQQHNIPNRTDNFAGLAHICKTPQRLHGHAEQKLGILIDKFYQRLRHLDAPQGIR